VNIYTAQYNYKGPDRVDITVKGDEYPGNWLAPTWAMVRGLQAGKITQWDYTVQYFSLLINRALKQNDWSRNAIHDLLTNRSDITLVCYCPSVEFCHRILAARLFENWGDGRYIGERTL
jgi:hypothetical protein